MTAATGRRHRKTSSDKLDAAFTCSGRPRLRQRIPPRSLGFSPRRVFWPLHERRAEISGNDTAAVEQAQNMQSIEIYHAGAGSGAGVGNVSEARRESVGR